MDVHDNHEKKESWLDRWWFLLVILFGVICVLALDLWHPGSAAVGHY